MAPRAPYQITSTRLIIGRHQTPAASHRASGDTRLPYACAPRVPHRVAIVLPRSPLASHATDLPKRVVAERAPCRSSVVVGERELPRDLLQRAVRAIYRPAPLRDRSDRRSPDTLRATPRIACGSASRPAIWRSSRETRVSPRGEDARE